MTFHIVTLFPEMFDSYLSESILARGKKAGKIDFKFYNPRDFAEAKNKRVEKPYLQIDDKPYGGGPGMVMKPEPVIKAIEKALEEARGKSVEGRKKKSKLISPNSYLKTKIIFFTPSGKLFDTSYAKQSAKKFNHLILVCGRYEGIDARVKKIFKVEEISVGPYVLTGGELPAMVLIDSISRQIKGVLGDFASLEETRSASPDVYTRPSEFSHKGKKYKVPPVLLNGDHKAIDEWRAKQK